MTPQGWIDATEDFDEVMDSDGGIYHGHPKQFVTEGATHLAAALEEIAERDAEIVGHRDEISLLHAKLSDAEEELDALRTQATGEKDV